MKIINHRLVADGQEPSIAFMASPNHGGLITPEWLVMHYTAARSAYGSVSWLCNPDAKASAHLVIGRDGKIWQLVEFNKRAWHAGQSEWAGREDVNTFSVGIELDNAGKLLSKNGKWVTDKFFDPVPSSEVGSHGDSAWHEYSQVQLGIAEDVGRLLVAEYKLKGVVGHSDIAPGRKIDPGPLFPMADFRKSVMPITEVS